MFELLMAQRPRVPAIAAQHGLTPAQCHALRLLKPGRPLAMGRLAAGLACDASNITGIVDRLETRGLIERHSAPCDRRIKEIALTPAGIEVRAKILQGLAEPPEAIARLTVDDHRALCAILRKVLGKAVP